jgi:hypothetical protein
MKQPFQGTVLRDMKTGEQKHWPNTPSGAEILDAAREMELRRAAKVGTDSLNSTALPQTRNLARQYDGGSPPK